jgi:hypothetical protein
VGVGFRTPLAEIFQRTDHDGFQMRRLSRLSSAAISPPICRAGIKVEGNFVKRKSAKLPLLIGNFAVRNALRSKGIAE